MTAAETYFVTWKGRRDGPYTVEQLESLLKNGDIGLLHRVETPAGQMPLRQLLDTVNAARTPAAGSPPSVASDATENPAVETVAPADANLREDEATRLYALCGGCFAVPPLAWWTWRSADRLAAKGNPRVAQRIKWLGTGLAAGGVLMWAVIWRMW
ncbi:MAG TPA: hypothetical protein VHC95_03730 [Opitutales bacterium]|nr:hypothetical protein [Opitutales bacterium]